ncbi:MAG: hypothetical protein M3Z98_02005 [Candidatus Dormibacteraeota bacterium]|nr:hypothetical protein [Candidatus Dormibacteraeota bacterium]
MSRGIAVLASVLLLAGCAYPGSAPARSFTTGFKSGETLRYRLHTTVNGSLTITSQQVPVNSDVTLTEVLEVASLDSAGSATVKVSTVDVTGGTSNTGAATPSGPVTLEIASDGRITSGAATQLSGRVPSVPGSDQLTPVYPGHSVKAGESWDVKYGRRNPFGTGEFRLNAHNKYLRDERVVGHDAAVIETAIEGPMDFTIDFSKVPAGTVPPAAGPIHYTGSISSTRQYWVDLAGNQVLKSTGSGTYRLSYALSAASGASGPQQVDFNGKIKTDLTRI